MLIFSALLAACLGAFVGRFMALSVYFLPPILFEGCDKGREPRHIIKWFFQKPFCWKCKGAKTWWEQAPILGYLINKGKCRFCQETVGMRPFLLELGIALLFGVSVLIFPVGPPLCLVLIATCLLICSFITDYDHGILPDQITLALLWTGLIASLNPVFVTPHEAIIGAVAGYGIFWAFNMIYLYFRGFDGMFPGDFKLNAGIGACLGIERLIPVLIVSFFLLVVVTMAHLLVKNRKIESSVLYQEIPYACSTAVVAAIALFYLLW